MTILRPTRDKIIHKNYMKKHKNGWITTCMVRYEMVVDGYSGKGFDFSNDDFHINMAYGLLVIIIRKGFIFDGVTWALDTADRMIFALLHDCACIASQVARDSVYENTLDDLSYTIIRKQGEWWNAFRAYRTKVAVKKWRSFKK